MAARRPWSLTLFSYSENAGTAKTGSDIERIKSCVWGREGVGGRGESRNVDINDGVYIFRCQIL